MYVYHLCIGVCRSQKAALGSLKLELLMGNMDGCEPLCSCWEPNPGPL